MICDRCLTSCAVGDHGVGLCPYEPRRATAVIQDTVAGGFVVENGFDVPTRFDSKSEHQRALARQGLELRVKWAGEHDRHLTRWDTVDLDAAKVLLERGGQARRVHADRWKGAKTPITTGDGGTFRAKPDTSC